MSEKILTRANMEKMILKALDNQDFIVYYQPQYDAKTNTIIGMEALVRWPNSDGSILSPIKFLPFSEDLGLIGPKQSGFKNSYVSSRHLASRSTA